MKISFKVLFYILNFIHSNMRVRWRDTTRVKLVKDSLISLQGSLVPELLIKCLDKSEDGKFLLFSETLQNRLTLWSISSCSGGFDRISVAVFEVKNELVFSVVCIV